jgi:hypothetical protein
MHMGKQVDGIVPRRPHPRGLKLSLRLVDEHVDPLARLAGAAESLAHALHL